MLYDGERIEPLAEGVSIIAREGGFSYGHDAVLLSGFIRARRDERGLDLGAGTGVIALLVHAHTGAGMLAVEIQQEMAEMARRSVTLNGLEGEIEVLCADMRELTGQLGGARFDFAVCNPPYYAGGTESPNEQRRLSTHEQTCTVEDVAQCGRAWLKNGGRLYISYPVSGLSRACAALENAGIAVKRAALVYTKRGAPPGRVLIEGRKGGKSGLTMEELRLYEG